MRHGSWIVDAVRTPFGRIGGALAGVRPDDLAAHALRALIGRQNNFDPTQIDDVIFGNANGAGEDNRNVARMAVLLAQLPVSVPGSTVTRLCGSGMESVMQASRALEVGDAHVCIAGGVESMSRAPWILPTAQVERPGRDATLYSSTLGWRMVNPTMPSEWTVPLGEGAEILAERFNISREQQDEFALRSHQRALLASAAGAFDHEIVGAPGVDLIRDESIRVTDLDRLASLRPVFRMGGTVTAGNSSPMNDGAAALLLVDEERLSKSKMTPLARIAGRAVSALEPQLYGLGPVEATERALKRAGIGWSELAVVEVNEAFAAQTLACMASMPDLDPSIVNRNGGAIAIGHPLGASGARLLTTLAWQLHNLGVGFGLATMCIGVGQGIAVVLEAA